MNPSLADPKRCQDASSQVQFVLGKISQNNRLAPPHFQLAFPGSATLFDLDPMTLILMVSHTENEVHNFNSSFKVFITRTDRHRPD